MKIYKCYDKHGSYKLLFSHNGISYCDNSLGNGKAIYSDEFTKVEPLETGDTLQEVVDWCDENEMELCISQLGKLHVGKLFIADEGNPKLYTKTDLLEHIRKPKLQEVTAEELAEMGYKLKED